MKVKNCLFILLIFSLVICSFAGAADSAKKDAQTKKIARRVDTEQDALGIAEEFMKQKGLAGDYYLFRYIIGLKAGVWQVVFLKKEVQKEFGKVKSMRIKINRNTGEVIESKEQEGFFIDKGFR